MIKNKTQTYRTHEKIKAEILFVMKERKELIISKLIKETKTNFYSACSILSELSTEGSVVIIRIECDNGNKTMDKKVLIKYVGEQNE